jgi:hypothetical protein
MVLVDAARPRMRHGVRISNCAADAVSAIVLAPPVRAGGGSWRRKPRAQLLRRYQETLFSSC